MKTLFVSIGSYGLMMPALGAAGELARRGHTPVFLTPPRGHDLVHGAGFATVDVEMGRLGLNTEGWWTPTQAVPQFRQVEAAVAKEVPDVIVTDHLAVGTIIAARALGVPLAVLGPAAYIHPVAALPAEQLSARVRVARYAKMADGYNQVAKEVGLAPTSTAMSDDSPFLGDRYLLRSVPSFEAYAASLPQRVRYVGACLHEAAPADPVLATWIDADPGRRPLAFVQVEKLFDFNDPIPALLGLVEQRGLRAAAALGRYVAKYHQLASDALFVRDHLPQGQVLDQARLVISTGHPTAVLGAICAGLPNLIVDFGSGAPELLHCCANAGNGVGLPGSHASAETLAPLLDRIMSDELMTSSARRVQRAFAEVDSFAAIADELDELVGQRQAERSSA
jgi:UDP:flavonoid glycosyltransferase YjiC (YdhE family)